MWSRRRYCDTEAWVISTSPAANLQLKGFRVSGFWHLLPFEKFNLTESGPNAVVIFWRHPKSFFWGKPGDKKIVLDIIESQKRHLHSKSKAAFAFKGRRPKKQPQTQQQQQKRQQKQDNRKSSTKFFFRHERWKRNVSPRSQDDTSVASTHAVPFYV